MRQQDDAVALGNERHQPAHLILHVGSEWVRALVRRAIRKANRHTATEANDPQVGEQLVAAVVHVYGSCNRIQHLGCLACVCEIRVVIARDEEMGNAVRTHLYAMNGEKREYRRISL